ncbi:MAG: DUF3137 domain-containing protein [Pseudomonadota bacterium]|nr:DUF3137 domain-containing protein [Pseudomonadota bacterium]
MLDTSTFKDLERTRETMKKSFDLYLMVFKVTLSLWLVLHVIVLGTMFKPEVLAILPVALTDTFTSILNSHQYVSHLVIGVPFILLIAPIFKITSVAGKYKKYMLETIFKSGLGFKQEKFSDHALYKTLKTQGMFTRGENPSFTMEIYEGKHGERDLKFWQQRTIKGKNTTIFSGMYLTTDMPNAPASTLLCTNLHKKVRAKHLSKFETNNSVFESKFNLYSDNADAFSPYLTDELLSKLDDLNQSFRSNRGKQDGEIKEIEFLIHEKKLYLAVPMAKGMFQATSLSYKSQSIRKDVEHIVKEIEEILSAVNVFSVFDQSHQ